LVVSWTIGTRPDSQLVNTMLDQAIETLHPGEHPIIHSDRGAHYRWPGWISRTRKAKLTRSMSKKGCSPDNAACEGFFGRLKTELVYPRNWQDVALDEFMRQIDVYIRWYNERRIKISLGRRSPMEHRQNLGLMPA
jgi:putative transposase